MSDEQTLEAKRNTLALKLFGMIGANVSDPSKASDLRILIDEYAAIMAQEAEQRGRVEGEKEIIAYCEQEIEEASAIWNGHEMADFMKSFDRDNCQFAAVIRFIKGVERTET